MFRLHEKMKLTNFSQSSESLKTCQIKEERRWLFTCNKNLEA
jgi:hypothetical protein